MKKLLVIAAIVGPGCAPLGPADGGSEGWVTIGDADGQTTRLIEFCGLASERIDPPVGDVPPFWAHDVFITLVDEGELHLRWAAADGEAPEVATVSFEGEGPIGCRGSIEISAGAWRFETYCPDSITRVSGLVSACHR